MVEKMVGHLTLERHREIVEKNKREFLAGLKPIEKTPENPNGGAVGCNLDPNDKSADAPRRYFEKKH